MGATASPDLSALALADRVPTPTRGRIGSVRNLHISERADHREGQRRIGSTTLGEVSLCNRSRGEIECSLEARAAASRTS